MTIDLNAIRERADAATRGPWTAGQDGLFKHEVWLTAFLPIVELSSGLQGEANAAFIAHARTDVPALLAEVERLRPVVEAARRAVNTDSVDEWNELVDVMDRLDQTEAATR